MATRISSSLTSTGVRLAYGEEFAELVSELVADEAPRVFALVEECGHRFDAWIIARDMELKQRPCRGSRRRPAWEPR